MLRFVIEQKHGSINIVTFELPVNGLFEKSGFKGAKTTVQEYI